MALMDILRRAPKPSDGLPDLEEALAKQEETIARAEGEVEAKESAFVELGDAASEKALTTAREQLERLLRHRDRTRVLLDRERARVAAEERRKMEARVAELEGLVSPDALRAAAQSLDVEFEAACEAVISAHRQRVETMRELMAHARELESLTLELYGADSRYEGHWIDDQGRSRTPMTKPSNRVQGAVGGPPITTRLEPLRRALEEMQR